MISEIIPMLEANNKIEAIKYVQQKEGMSLIDAKTFIEEAAEVMHRMPSMFKFKENPVSKNTVYQTNFSTLDLKIKALIERENLIGAIKIYRDETGAGLLEAKKYCEDFACRNNLMK